MKKYYPAVFHEEDGGYTVTFPDIPGCVTEGDSLEEALRMAKDAMGICLVNDFGDFYYPNASDPKSVETDEESFCMLVGFDELEYLKNTQAKQVI